MILFWLVAILIAAGVLAGVAARWSDTAPRVICLGALATDFGLCLGLWSGHYPALATIGPPRWFAELSWNWIPQWGIRFHLAVDGLGLALILLTLFLGIMAVLASWRGIQRSAGFFHFNLLWVLAGVMGVFLAVDLFLFYFFWELMLVPMYFLIAVWGYERRIYAAIKFFLFTQISSLLMLAAIVALAVLHQSATGSYSFEYEDLLSMPLAPGTEMLLALGFLAAFAVKLPAFAIHTWLPDAHAEAPTAGSVILAGLLLKTGAFGMLRFVLPLFPNAARQLAPWMMTLGVIGILYGAVLAFAQTDLKRMVAYTSVSHMGFVLLGIFAMNDIALQGALIQMLSHGVSTGALFILAGALNERLHSRDLRSMGGLWDTMPVLSGAGLFFVMASAGMPGLGDFVGEFLVLTGTYRVSPVLAALGALGMIAGACYALRLVQTVFFGPNVHNWRFPDAHWYEWSVAAPMMACLLWIGLYPQPVLNVVRPAIDGIRHQIAVSTLAKR
ncbi:MAG: NADH-quinone oxidoreductase subunit [Bryobacterales bacterium]|nr:NADH-quinone oxidoreductase subunit [Bryobacterales bacterium]